MPKIKSKKYVDITFNDVKEWYNANLHPDVIDLNDQSVYKRVYHDGRWAGIFQCTQPGAQKLFERAKPKSIVDIAALTSIYRPGPLAANVDDIYVKAMAEPDKVDYGHPLVKQVLEKTGGCIIFQEQLMMLANVVGGLSLEKCDKLRKVITKRSVSGASKAKEEALKLEKEFIAGAIKNGLGEAQAVDLFNKISYFAGYGFNACLAYNELIDVYDELGNFLKTQKICDCVPGQFVLSRDESTGTKIYVQIVDVYDNGEKDVVMFDLDNGKSVICTVDHKFRTQCGQMLPIGEIIERKLDINCE